MEAFIDIKLLKKMQSPGFETGTEALKEASVQRLLLDKDQTLQLLMGWPALFEYLDLSAIFTNFHLINEKDSLFSTIQKALTSGAEDKVLIHLYDQIFVDCLTHVKALPQVDQVFLVNKIQAKPRIESFSRTIHYYEQALIKNPAHLMHDLILYLAWDRVCVNLAILFESSGSDANTTRGLKVFRECLIESFLHIRNHGKTIPGFFRLMEALYAYDLRQEHLDKHSEEEWKILCKGGEVLQPRNVLADAPYIDNGILDVDYTPNIVIRTYTMESVGKIETTQALAKVMMEMIKKADTNWHLKYGPVEVISVADDLKIEAILK